MASRMYGKNIIHTIDLGKNDLAFINWCREYGETGLSGSATVKAKDAADLLEFIQEVYEHGIALGRYQGADAIKELTNSKTSEFRNNAELTF